MSQKPETSGRECKVIKEGKKRHHCQLHSFLSWESWKMVRRGKTEKKTTGAVISQPRLIIKSVKEDFLKSRRRLSYLFQFYHKHETALSYFIFLNPSCRLKQMLLFYFYLHLSLSFNSVSFLHQS